jgi:A/G-specific adenine glycosylase
MLQNLPNKKLANQFRSLLLAWNKKENKRKMPWKGEKDPYKIWLSEVILQQTRVEQGLDYYERFIQQYPTINHLAEAKDEAVFKLWEGLGYYSRCRNLLATARYISFEKSGVFPATYAEILGLKGVGPYTAAAIASFAFSLPHAVVDGNVFRVLARYFGIDKPIDTTAGKKLFTAIANILLDKAEPAIYNQALMDFGATVCKPASPHCLSCVLNKHCMAYAMNKVAELPLKKKKISIKKRWFYYFILKFQNKVFIQQRSQKDIWHHLHEFYLFESDKAIKWTEKKAAQWLYKEFSFSNCVIERISSERKQQLTHQHINGVFIEVLLDQMPTNLPETSWLSAKKMNNLAFPRFITTYLEEKN